MVSLAYLHDGSKPGQSGYAIYISLAVVSSEDCAAYKEHSIDVVDIAIFPSSVEEGVFWYSDLRAVEYGWLSSADQLCRSKTGTHFVHVIPDIQVGSRFLQISYYGRVYDRLAHLPDLHLEHPSPPIPTLWIEEIHPDTTSRPTPTFKFTSIRTSH